ncbi:MAG: hypothetical protein DWQ34_11655 [Planctomycetota bacterium]|nr:MAG: hypothetical protein DWQ34_11655 [Planctomycetota bacterium]REK30106.1 MAG: hypothetical protein DWQ41_02960 [Planctomycetota bacterium]REK37652.1 MAG: hypothetical protein DWQ45_06565 [Planctomycetota bacterium]
MVESLQTWFSWPTLPFSLLLSAVLAYWLVVILGALDVDMFDFDIDLDPGLDGHESLFDWGLVGLRWLNLGDVPLMVWMSVFGLAAWLSSTMLDKGMTDPTAGECVISILRSTGIGLVAAKLLTQPLKGKLKLVEPNPVESMIGRTCVITSSEATPEHGRASCQSDGAPLILNVRSMDGPIAKGETAEIVDYSQDQHLYYVRTMKS